MALGWVRWKASEEQYFLGLLGAALDAMAGAGLITIPAGDDLTARMLLAALDEAGLAEGATALHFTSFDGVYTESLTIDQARLPNVIVAYQMLGGPVTREHGGPVRLYVAPMYGYKSIKWLSTISVVDHVEPGYWEDNGYAVDAWIGRSNGL